MYVYMYLSKRFQNNDKSRSFIFATRLHGVIKYDFKTLGLESSVSHNYFCTYYYISASIFGGATNNQISINKYICMENI